MSSDNIKILVKCKQYIKWDRFDISIQYPCEQSFFRLSKMTKICRYRTYKFIILEFYPYYRKFNWNNFHTDNWLTIIHNLFFNIWPPNLMSFFFIIKLEIFHSVSVLNSRFSYGGFFKINLLYKNKLFS